MPEAGGSLESAAGNIHWPVLVGNPDVHVVLIRRQASWSLFGQRFPQAAYGGEPSVDWVRWSHLQEIREFSHLQLFLPR